MTDHHPSPKDTFYNELTGFKYYRIGDNIKHYIKSNKIGLLILNFKLNEKDRHRKQGEYCEIMPNDLMLDAFFIHFESNNENCQYDEMSIRRYIYDQRFNTINRYNVKYINLADLLEKIGSHPTVNPDGLDHELKIDTNKIDATILVITSEYTYRIPLNIVKNLTSIEQIRPVTAELFNDMKLFFGLYNKINEVRNFLSGYNIHFSTKYIDKNKLKTFATFCNSFNEDRINKYIQNIDQSSLNRFLTLIEKTKDLVVKRQLKDINFTIKGIKISYNFKYNDIIFEIPLFRCYVVNKYNIEVFYAYLSSINEFDSLIYRLEQEYLSSI